ncbi:MAG: UpxY family transcription antiterminator [Bacteroidales bacterium]|nr:UpxY family transcription antiterminator [Bacteroidales bacterium]
MDPFVPDNKLHWFVAYVLSCQERKAAEALKKLGVEYYLPIQQERHQWSDRVKIVERMVLPRMIFIRTTLARRPQLLGEVRVLSNYMTKGGAFHPIIVPDEQMDTFRFMVEHSHERVEFVSGAIATGSRCLIVSGPLQGFECEVVYMSGTSYAAVRIESVGAFVVQVPTDAIRVVVE